MLITLKNLPGVCGLLMLCGVDADIAVAGLVDTRRRAQFVIAANKMSTDNEQK